MKVGFFFGAGAEISYGMPSGGKFALNIFKKSVEDHKEPVSYTHLTLPTTLDV